MNPIKNFLTVIYIFCSTVCSAQFAKIDSTNVKKLRIDPQAAKGIPVSALFQNIKFIPLETNKESIFGQITKLEVLKDRLVILDYDTWSVLIFDKNGKYINKITDKTISALGSTIPPGSKHAFSGFITTTTDNGDFIDIPGKNVIFRFNKDGVFKEKIPGIYENIIYQIQDGKITSGFTTDKDTYYEFSVMSKTDTGKFFPFKLKRYEEDEYIITGPKFDYVKGANRMLFHNYYSYDLFDVSKAGVAFKYQIILPDDIALPKDFLSNPVYRLKKEQYFSDNRKKVYGLSGCYEIGDYLYFTLSTMIQQRGIKESLAYNLKTGELISLQDINPDKQSYFLPINDSPVDYNFLRRGFDYYDPYNNNLYTSISSAAMIRLDKQNTNKDKRYPKPLADYFKNADNTKNPIIIMVQPKD